MKVLFLTSNDNALPLYDWISKHCEVVLCRDRISIEYIRKIVPDLTVSYNYSYIVKKECIDELNGRIINLHTSYLPWNKGASPNLWSFIDGTPKGVTIHMLSPELDGGDILYQRTIDMNPSEETFKTAYSKLQKAIIELFKEHWSDFENGNYLNVTKSQISDGTIHTLKDLEMLRNKINFSWDDNIGEFLNRLDEEEKLYTS